MRLHYFQNLSPSSIFIPFIRGVGGALLGSFLGILLGSFIGFALGWLTNIRAVSSYLFLEPFFFTRFYFFISAILVAQCLGFLFSRLTGDDSKSQLIIRRRSASLGIGALIAFHHLHPILWAFVWIVLPAPLESPFLSGLNDSNQLTAQFDATVLHWLHTFIWSSSAFNDWIGMGTVMGTRVGFIIGFLWFFLPTSKNSGPPLYDKMMRTGKILINLLIDRLNTSNQDEQEITTDAQQIGSLPNNPSTRPRAIGRFTI